MDALMLKMNLPSNIQMTATVFGLPRGGNQAFADMIDSMVGSLFSFELRTKQNISHLVLQLGDSFTFVTNQHDIVPTVPPRFLDFQHSQGEIHIQSSDAATGNATSVVSCPGQENSNCIEGNSILDTTLVNHIGKTVSEISIINSNAPIPIYQVLMSRTSP